MGKGNYKDVPEANKTEREHKVVAPLGRLPEKTVRLTARGVSISRDVVRSLISNPGQSKVLVGFTFYPTTNRIKLHQNPEAGHLYSFQVFSHGTAHRKMVPKHMQEAVRGDYSQKTGLMFKLEQ